MSEIVKSLSPNQRFPKITLIHWANKKQDGSVSRFQIDDNDPQGPSIMRERANAGEGDDIKIEKGIWYFHEDLGWVKHGFQGPGGDYETHPRRR
ncbi:MAG TPA: hypothetical protein VLB73_01250 [Patescibacteria group bacterium]|nr:hypothetical protein [Patescibacteria group bacterium]